MTKPSGRISMVFEPGVLSRQNSPSTVASSTSTTALAPCTWPVEIGHKSAGVPAHPDVAAESMKRHDAAPAVAQIHLAGSSETLAVNRPVTRCTLGITPEDNRLPAWIGRAPGAGGPEVALARDAETEARRGRCGLPQPSGTCR